jgi:hypothetical protein
MKKDRYLSPYVLEDLEEKMVFIGGARQVGKTTFAVDFIGERFQPAAYFNWDNREDRQKIRSSDWPGTANLLIFDEIHKYKGWKRFIKGEYDKLKSRYKFLVTGSARLDVYRKGGDSLQGRYHYFRLHPFSLAEMIGKSGLPKIFEELVLDSRNYPEETDALLAFGGFPEPLLKGTVKFLRRWHTEKVERLFREEITAIEQIRDLGNMKILSDLLPARVGSLLSANALREDLEVSHKAVSRWLTILEVFYYHFRIHPFARSEVRSIKKEPKLYLWDWSEVEDPGNRFENMIAGHLLKFCHLLHDAEGHRTELHFLRTIEKKEVDFLVTVDRKPWFAVEAKLTDREISPALRYFKDRLKIPFVYQVLRESGTHRYRDGIHVVSADRFLSGLV